MFSEELLRGAFQATNGEFGWTRTQIPHVVQVLRSQSMGILGGELWWVRDGEAGWHGSIPQRQGPPGVYTWITERQSGETWQAFVDRGASDALAAAKRWPTPGELPPDLPGRILYNLTWISEPEYSRQRPQSSEIVP